MKNLPLRLTIQIDSTNGSTMTKGIESIYEILKRYNFPKKGQVVEDKEFSTPYWKVTVLESVTRL